MKAIILSAGQGSRLKPVTNDRPKGMVEVGGRTIIEHQMATFRRVGIEDISVVEGFCAEAIPDLGQKRYRNQEFATTNMVYSLFCAEPEMDADSVVVSYGDILYADTVLRSLLASTGSVSVIVDRDWESYWTRRFDNPYDDAESLVIDGDGLIARIGESRPTAEDVHAQYIGLMRFDRDGLNALRELHETFAGDETQLGWGRVWRDAYMTDLLQELINRGVEVHPVSIHGRWCEVDTLTDLELAETLVQELGL